MKLAGVLWVVAGVFNVGITIGFRNDALQWVLTIAAGLVAVVLGLFFAVRPTAALVPWSNAAGIAWLILFALLTAAQAHELVAWSTDVVLAALGLAAAVVAY